MGCSLWGTPPDAPHKVIALIDEATGAPDPVNGIREITVGTGGSDHTSLRTIAANSVVTNTNTFGILQVTLHASSYSWRFMPAVGSFTESGSATCHA